MGIVQNRKAMIKFLFFLEKEISHVLFIKRIIRRIFSGKVPEVADEMRLIKVRGFVGEAAPAMMIILHQFKDIIEADDPRKKLGG